MRRLLTTCVSFACVFVASSDASGQVAIVLEKAVGATAATVKTPPALEADQTIHAKGDSLTVNVTCEGFPCAQIDAKITVGTAGTVSGTTTRQPNAATFKFTKIAATGGALLLVVTENAQTVKSYAVKVDAATIAQAPAGISLNDLRATNCDAEVAKYADIATYETATGVATFVVSPNGLVYRRPAAIIDENDVVRVIVVGDTRLLPRLVVSRTSSIRTTGDISIVGEGLTVPGADRFGLAADQPACTSVQVKVTDFAPGAGEITIRALGTDGQSETGKVSFGVNRLFSGAFAFAPVFTWLRKPTYGLAFVNGDSVITEKVSREPRVTYALAYVPFLRGRRDLEKPAPSLGGRINPVLAVSFRELEKNAFVGLTADYATSIFVIVGLHAGEVTRLDPRSNLHLGSVFQGPSSSIPTVKKWDASFFTSVGLDLRAAVKLLTAVAGAATGK